MLVRCREYAGWPMKIDDSELPGLRVRKMGILVSFADNEISHNQFVFMASENDKMFLRRSNVPDCSRKLQVAHLEMG